MVITYWFSIWHLALDYALIYALFALCLKRLIFCILLLRRCRCWNLEVIGLQSKESHSGLYITHYNLRKSSQYVANILLLLCSSTVTEVLRLSSPLLEVPLPGPPSVMSAQLLTAGVSSSTHGRTNLHQLVTSMATCHLSALATRFQKIFMDKSYFWSAIS